MKVLIADDEVTSQILLEETLQEWGYDVCTANDGLEAWKRINEPEPPSLVILDWMMPGMDGPELCRRMRASMLSQYVYIILLTSKSEKKDVILGMDSGADAFLTKPVDLDELKCRLAAGKRILAHQSQISERPAQEKSGPCAVPPAAEFDVPENVLQPVDNLSQDPLLALAPRCQIHGRSMPVLGKAVILNRIGEGGMGAVYRGYDPRIQQEVAVKVLSATLFRESSDAAARFYREAQIAALVNSEHVVSVQNVGQEHGIVYLTMEMVHGVTAADCVKKALQEHNAGLDEFTALDICIAATKGMIAAHDNGIVHRDIKPDNILIPFNKSDKTFDYPAAKLADLGIARHELTNQNLTQTNSSMGTPGFMAPEQVYDAKHVGKSADIFGMGATLYALLTARAPFFGTSPFAVFANTVSSPHQPLARFRPDVSSNTASIIDICLEKDPRKRYPDAKSLLEALQFKPRTQLVAQGWKSISL